MLRTAPRRSQAECVSRERENRSPGTLRGNDPSCPRGQVTESEFEAVKARLLSDEASA
jgi:hypothetical protein